MLNKLFIDDENIVEKLSSILKVQDQKVFSSWSMPSYGLMLLSDEIQSRRRKSIIEFGSGASSIVMARSLQKYNPGGKVISIESDPYYCDNLNDFVYNNNLDDTIQFIYAPLYPCSYLSKNKWYDQRILHELIDDHIKFDMVVIDGPPAWHDNIKLSRYGAVPFVFDHLADEYSIFLDDANRDGENVILKMWNNQYKIDFTILYDRIAISRNESFNI